MLYQFSANIEANPNSRLAVVFSNHTRMSPRRSFEQQGLMHMHQDVKFLALPKLPPADYPLRATPHMTPGTSMFGPPNSYLEEGERYREQVLTHTQDPTP